MDRDKGGGVNPWRGRPVLGHSKSKNGTGHAGATADVTSADPNLNPLQKKEFIVQSTTSAVGDVQLFSNDEFELPIEFEHGQIHAYMAPIARGLGYRDAANLARSLPEHCVEKREVRETAGHSVPSIMRLGNQEDWYLTEEGFYRALGQRQTSKIKDPEIRARVERFQAWVFGVVLPALRREGSFTPLEPGTTWTYGETAAVIRQRYGFDFSVNGLARAYRDASVFGQNGIPRKKYRDWFWFTGSAWNLHAHMLPQLVSVISAKRHEIVGAQSELVLFGGAGAR